jgi:hypothetical protein
MVGANDYSPLQGGDNSIAAAPERPKKEKKQHPRFPSVSSFIKIKPL